MPLSLENRHDIKRLSDVLSWAEALLIWLVNHGVRKSPAQQALAETLRQLHEAIATCTGQLRSIEDDLDPRMERLHEAGLSGPMLQTKLAIREMILNAPRAAGLFERITNRIAGSSGLGRTLRWLNSFLGSLAKAIPGADFVKEYKDGVELVIEHHGDAPSVPRDVLDTRIR
jgi:hypothetical protein